MSFSRKTSTVQRFGLICAFVFCILAVGIPHFTPSLNNPGSPLPPPTEVKPIAMLQPKFESKIEKSFEIPEEVVANGQRVVALKLNFRQSVEGFAREGSFVDVVWTHVNKAGELKSEIIASRAKVFAAREEGNQGFSEQKILLEVTPQESLQLINIRGIAETSFILRNSNEGPTQMKIATTSEVSGSKEQRGYCPSRLESALPVGTKAFSSNIKTPLAVGFLSACYWEPPYKVPMPQMN